MNMGSFRLILNTYSTRNSIYGNLPLNILKRDVIKSLWMHVMQSRWVGNFAFTTAVHVTDYSLMTC